MIVHTPMLRIVFGALLLSLAGCADLTRPDGPSAQRSAPETQPSFDIDGVTEVFGSNNPAVDVPAVQEAVDAGGTVVLHGTFSFDGVNLPGPDGHRRVILVTNSVEIRGDDATILAGGLAADGGFQAAFLIDSPDADVALEAIRFVNPHNAAIRALKSGDLRIERCEIDGVVPTSFGSQSGALGIDLRGEPFGRGDPFGAVTIVGNRLRIGGTQADRTGGISIGGPAVRVEITENTVNETTSHALNLRNIDGPVRVEGNVVVTGPVGSDGRAGRFVDALRVLGTGTYRIAHNELDCGFPNAAVLRIAATERAEVLQNEIVASMAADETPGAESAGIQVRGSATANEILGNRIRGRGRVAISVVHSDFPPDKPDGTDGNPRETTFIGNSIQQFVGSVAAVEIGEGAENTTIVGGSGILIDNGTGTVVLGDFRSP